MKLTEKQIWKCNNNDEGGVYICLEHQNVVDFARSIEREIGFARAELWIKRINDAVLTEREVCAEICDRFAERQMHPAECAAAIRARTT